MTIVEIRSLERRAIWLFDQAEICMDLMRSQPEGSKDRRDCFSVADIWYTRAGEAAQKVNLARSGKP